MPTDYGFSRPKGTPPPTVSSSSDPYGFARPTSGSEDGQEGVTTGQAIAGAAVGLGGLALLTRAPGPVGKIAKGLNTLRQQLMLSGYALPKSVLGGIGAGVEAGFESKSLTPLKKIFSRETLKDIGTAYKKGGLSSGTAGIDEKAVHGPGRLMGAVDEAVQGALRRAGYSAEDAQARLLQTPLPKRLAKSLESPAAKYIQPFRRTPFNQFLEGYERLPTSEYSQAHPFITAGYTGAGALHGAATTDEQYPTSIPIGVAASSRQGVNYALGALLGRYLGGGKGAGGIASSALPVSEYGLESAVTDPTRPFTRPSILKLLEDLGLD